MKAPNVLVFSRMGELGGICQRKIERRTLYHSVDESGTNMFAVVKESSPYHR
jgi:hypothetical protein